MTTDKNANNNNGSNNRSAGFMLFLLISCLMVGHHVGMAVDRSKFRTCSQTSFCRRHREDHSSRLYDYRLVKESVHFHISTHYNQGRGGVEGEADDINNNANANANAANREVDPTSETTTGIWKSLQRNLGIGGSGRLGVNDSGASTAAGGGKDVYVVGPEPTLTGILENVATETSTESKKTEKLELSVFALADGILRLRVTEIYEDFEKARVTYDELVLSPRTLVPAEHAKWIRPAAADDNEDTILLSRLAPEGSDLSNYMALQYGDQEGKAGMVLLMRLNPFSVYLFREDDIAAGPITTMADRGRMHFEIRRPKEDNSIDEDSSGGGVDEEGIEEKTSSEEKNKEEKEIVGYWEDGLAIYSDGTREKKKVTDSDGGRHGRKLVEEGELDRNDLWEESFSSHKDSKPYGPMSVGMDITFPGSHHLFGLPEHASSTLLQKTRGSNAHYKDPYRLYNLDVFEYELDETMALYGQVPLLVSQSVRTGTSGVFWFNPTETFVDVMEASEQEADTLTTHLMSESGIVDLFFLPGPNPSAFYRQYADITGTMQLPPIFSLGYHQCRWNYKDEKDVYDVHEHFEEYDYPYDVLWLDIEHTDGKRYFTWDHSAFPHPEQMQEKLASQGRKMVTIVDPHIKRDNNYYIHKEATAKGLYIKKSNGKEDYDGWCWPGSSSYLDFTSARVRSWWAEQFSYDRYKGSTPSLYTWNDMNEPSVFNGPEVSMQKDLRNLNGEEHREWHNLYGMLFHRATSEGLVLRNEPDHDIRPFVLSRAFFAGSQKYGAIWTGDNKSEWSHLVISSPMLLSMNIAALSFVGADVGGFFGDPDAELFTRWMQAGAYQPFFRGHAHHDSKRREPWVYGTETLERCRRAAMERYALLPYWYSVFNEAGVTGMPVMRTMWMQYPKVEEFFHLDDQYLIGSDLLVKPVTEAGVFQQSVHFPPGGDVWYHGRTLEKITKGDGGFEMVTVKCTIDEGIPIFQRGGSIIPRKLRLRRSAPLMKNDPYTLYVALDNSQRSTGELYMDDEESFGHVKREEYAKARFRADFSDRPAGGAATIRNTVTVGKGWQQQEHLVPTRMVERIIIMGLEKAPGSVLLSDNKEEIGFQYSEATHLLVLRKPEISALEDWEITFSFPN